MNPPLSHPHVLPTGKKRPAIALIIPNTLTALGLSGLLTRMVPHAEIALFHDFREAEAETERGKAFFHYFTTAPVLLNHAAFFLRHQQKTIVLVHGDDVRHLPQGFHTLNVLQSEKSSSAPSCFWRKGRTTVAEESPTLCARHKGNAMSRIC